MALNAVIGFGAMVGLREEASYGTSAGASTHWLPVISVTPATDIGVTPIPYLGVANAQGYHAQRDHCVLRHDASIEIRGVVCYDDPAFCLLLKHAFGSVNTTGSGPYTSTFTLDSDGVVGMTLQVLHGTGLTAVAELYLGCRVTRMSFDVAAQGYMTYSATIIARSAEDLGAVAGTPAFAAAEEVLAHHGGSFTHNNHSIAIRSLSWTIDNNLQRRPQIGSVYTDTPVPGGFASLTWEIERSWEGSEYYADYLDGTRSDATITFTGTGSNSFALELSNAVMTSFAKPVDRAGELTQRISGIALASPSAEQGIDIVIVTASDPFA